MTSPRLAEIKRQLKRTEGWGHFKYIVDSVALNPGTVEQVKECRKAINTNIPITFWNAMKEQGLIELSIS